MLNLDTHILLHALTGDLTAKENKVLSADNWSISGIVLWEIAKLAQLKRIEFDFDDVETVRALSAIHVWPIDIQICRHLALLDFKSDPADEIIAATSLAHKIPLVTRDKIIRKSRKVELAC